MSLSLEFAHNDSSGTVWEMIAAGKASTIIYSVGILLLMLASPSKAVIPTCIKMPLQKPKGMYASFPTNI